MFVDEGDEPLDVHIALKRRAVGWIVGLGGDEVDRGAACGAHVGACCVKMVVVGDEVAGFDEQATQDVLRGPPLMGRHKVRESKDVVNGGGEIIVIPSACVGLVALNDPRPLMVTHSRCARVG